MPEQIEPFRAIISASNLYRRKLCPGSAAAEDGLPDFSPNAAQRLGNNLHYKEFDEDESREALKAGELRALEKNKRLSDEFVAQTFRDLEIQDPGPVKLFKEREFFLSDSDGNPVNPAVPGHADEVRWYPKVKVAFVFDSKFGRKPVAPAESNYQLRFYFVVVRDEIGGDLVFGAIRQPYLSAPDDFHSVEYNASDTEVARAEILGIISDCQKPNAKRIPSEDACTYCKAQCTKRCPESYDFIRSLKRLHIVQMGPDKLEALGPDIMVAENVIEAWYDRMHMIAEKYPELLKRYGLARTQFTHSVPNIAGAYQKLSHFFEQERNTITYDGFLKFVGHCCKLSLPQIRNYFVKHQNMTEDDAEALIIRALGQQFEGDEYPVEDALIFSKPKRRMLVQKIKTR